MKTLAAGKLARAFSDSGAARMGDVIQFRDYGTRPARPNNTKADRAFWMGHTERQGRGCYLTGPRAPDDLVMPCADPGIAGMEWVEDSGDCA